MKIIKIKYCDDCYHYIESHYSSFFICDKTLTKYKTDDEEYKTREIPDDCPLEDAEGDK